MLKTIIFMLLLVFTINFFVVQTVVASDGTEVYDIRRGDVVLAIPNSNYLQNLAKDWLSSAIGIAGSFRIEPNDGIAIKIPLTPPYKVRNKWITGTVTEVIMFVGRSKTYYPTLLVLTKENHLMAFYIKDHNLEKFLNNCTVQS